MKILITKYFNWFICCFLLLSGTFGCDTEPPVKPYLPVVIEASVTGDVTLDYKSQKVFTATVVSDVYQFQFSSTATIDNEKYALTISIFPESQDDTSGVFTVVKPGDNSVKENYAYVLFITGYDTPRQIPWWGTEGTVDLTEMIMGKGKIALIGNFDFKANSTKDAVIKTITVSDGWIDFYRKF